MVDFSKETLHDNFNFSELLHVIGKVFKSFKNLKIANVFDHFF